MNYLITLTDGAIASVEATGCVHVDAGALVLGVQGAPLVFAARTWLRAEPQAARITWTPPPAPESPSGSGPFTSKGFA